MGESSQLVLVERVDDRIGVVTINRPAARNPLDLATVIALHEALDALEENGLLRVCIVTGAPPAFSAGGDLKGYVALYDDPSAFREFLEEIGRLFGRLERGPFVSIAMVNGVCVAGGLELALSCDLVIACESSRIGDLHINYGQIPGAGGSQRLVRAVGTLRAKALLFSGRLHTAEEAYAMGLVSAVVPDADLHAEVLRTAAELAERTREGVARIKELMAVAVDVPQSEGLRIERDVVVEYATTSNDAREGLTAFAESRRPRFADR